MDRKEVTTEFGIDAGRIIAFSDGVFAFAITLLVLKIDIPTLNTTIASSTLMGELVQLWPQYLANIISFLVIGYYWLVHHKLFLLIKRYNTTLIWLNIILLMSITFLPFSTDLMGTYNNDPVALAFYSLNLCLVGFIILLMWVYASYNHRLIDKDLNKDLIRYYTIKAFIAPTVFAVSVPLSFVHPLIAQSSWFILFIISATYKHKLERSELS